MSTLKERKLKFETLQLHVGQEEPDPVTDARAVPIYQTSSYVFHNSKHAADRFGLRDAGNIYGRLTNPTEDIFEQRIAALEGGVAALAVGSGAAAVTYTIENLAQAGDHIVSAKNIYGGTYNLLAHTLVDFGVTTTFVDPFNLEEVEGAIKDNTKAVYIETLGNPNSEVVDIEALAEIAHKHKIPLVIDNTFGTPYLIRPIEYGADIVVHSATKFIGGHGTTIGGVIIEGGNFDWKASGKFPWISDPNPSYHGISLGCIRKIPTAHGTKPKLSWRQLRSGSRTGSIRDKNPCYFIKGYRSNTFSNPCIYLFTGLRDIILKSRASCGKCIKGCGVFRETATG